MSQVAEHAVRAERIETKILKAESFILIDPEGNPVAEIRGGRNKTLQIMDKFGNICSEIHFGQTPGKHIRGE